MFDGKTLANIIKESYKTEGVDYCPALEVDDETGETRDMVLIHGGGWVVYCRPHKLPKEAAKAIVDIVGYIPATAVHAQRGESPQDVMGALVEQTQSKLREVEREASPAAWLPLVYGDKYQTYCVEDGGAAVIDRALLSIVDKHAAFLLHRYNATIKMFVYKPAGSSAPERLYIYEADVSEGMRLTLDRVVAAWAGPAAAPETPEAPDKPEEASV